MKLPTQKNISPAISPFLAKGSKSNEPELAAMAILGFGTALPEHSISQQDAATMAESIWGISDERRTRLLKKLYHRTGVDRRHSVALDSSSDAMPATQSFFGPAKSDQDGGPPTSVRMEAYEEYAAKIAIAASRQALQNAQVKSSEITHLVTVSCSGFSAPGVDIQIINQLGLPFTTERTNIGFMGCHGAINGLRVARGITTADPNACVLLCAVELCTLHQQYDWDPDQTVANALFADGAAALVGMQTQPIRRSDVALPVDTKPVRALSRRPWRIVGGGSAIVPNTTDLMSWRVGDHGFRMTLSPQVPTVIEKSLSAWLRPWLAAYGLDPATVGSWAAHPGGPRILAATAAGVGISIDRLEASTQILRQYGNMSSPTILFVLDELHRQQAALPCVVIGFGPGLAIEAALIV